MANAAAAAMQARPPETMANGTLISPPTTPASTSPEHRATGVDGQLDPADPPRKSSGVRSAAIVPRKTPETMSAPPATAKRTSTSGRGRKPGERDGCTPDGDADRMARPWSTDTARPAAEQGRGERAGGDRGKQEPVQRRPAPERARPGPGTAPPACRRPWPSGRGRRP